MAKRLSIVIPTLNRAALIEDAVTAAVAIDYSDKEVIVSNNCSDDDTRSVLADLERRAGVVAVHHPRRLNLAIHWNTVIREVASGDYVIIVPDDDRVTDPGYLSTAVDLLEKHPQAAICFGNYRAVDKEGDEAFRVVAQFEAFVPGHTMLSLYNKTVFGIRGIGIPQLTAVFRRSAYEEVGGFDHDCLSPDTYLWLKILCRYDCCFVSSIVAEYRVHSGSVSLTSGLELYRRDLQIPERVLASLGPSAIRLPVILPALLRMKAKFVGQYWGARGRKITGQIAGRMHRYLARPYRAASEVGLLVRILLRAGRNGLRSRRGTNRSGTLPA